MQHFHISRHLLEVLIRCEVSRNFGREFVLEDFAFLWGNKENFGGRTKKWTKEKRGFPIDIIPVFGFETALETFREKRSPSTRSSSSTTFYSNEKSHATRRKPRLPPPPTPTPPLKIDLKRIEIRKEIRWNLPRFHWSKQSFFLPDNRVERISFICQGEKGRKEEEKTRLDSGYTFPISNESILIFCLVVIMMIMAKISTFWCLSVLGFMCVLPANGQFSSDCGRKDYDKCVRLADPLLTDAHLIFPDNMADVDNVCRTWSKFVDCIKSYIDRCFTESRRKEFNKAVESPVDSVYQMCTSSSYQKEYLQHASCLKSTLTEDIHCGRYYKQLVAHVQGPREMGRSDLCCSHHRFRECVLTETKRACDVKVKPPTKMMASAFSRQILDKALSFLREQCSNYIPNHGECPGYQVPPSRHDDNFVQPAQSTPQVETRYLTNDQVFSDNFQPTVRDYNQPTINPLSWIPSSRDSRRKSTQPAERDYHPGQESKTTILMDNTPTSSSRSSYGRGMSMSPTEATPKDDSIFKATHYKPSTESWYPGNNINFYNPEKEINDFQKNEVDEPNQQGLSRLDSDSDSGAATIWISYPCLYLVMAFIFGRP